MWTCDRCGDHFSAGDADAVSVDGEDWCVDCDAAEAVTCCQCGERVPRASATSAYYSTWSRRVGRLRIYCGDCAAVEVSECGSCRDLFERDALFDAPNGDDLCEACHDAAWTRCSDCESLISCDEIGSDDLCESCRLSAVIRDHGYKPDPDFRGYGPLYLGFELEIEAPQSASLAELASGVLDQAGDLLYAKQDSSLTHGFEIVSHPADWQWWRENRQALAPMFRLADAGCRSYDTTTCGMHVHMSKAGFSGLHLYKFLRLFYEFPAWTLKMSRRRKDRLDRWCSTSVRESLAKMAKTKDQDGSRYCAVNLNSSQTVEVRIFRGTLSESGFWRNLELCHAAYAYTAQASVQEVSPDGLRTWLAGHAAEYPALCQAWQIAGMSATVAERANISESMLVTVEV